MIQVKKKEKLNMTGVLLVT